MKNAVFWDIKNKLVHHRKLSATESSLLMLCKIWGYHGGNYEECRLLGCYAAWLIKNHLVHSVSSCRMSRWVASPYRKTMQDLRFSRRWLLRMPSSGMLRCVALVTTFTTATPHSSNYRELSFSPHYRPTVLSAKRSCSWASWINIVP
jgi:hypothetical protein